MKKVFYVTSVETGKRHKAIYYENNSGRWVEFFGKDAPPPQAVVSKSSYAYINGGPLFQDAVDVIMEEVTKKGSTD